MQFFQLVDVHRTGADEIGHNGPNHSHARSEKASVCSISPEFQGVGSSLIGKFKMVCFKVHHNPTANPDDHRQRPQDTKRNRRRERQA